MIYYYRYGNKILFSRQKIKDLQEIDLAHIPIENIDDIYCIQDKDWKQVNSLVTLIHPAQILEDSQNREIGILQKPDNRENDFNFLPGWIRKKIERRKVALCNYGNPRWKDRLNWVFPKQWKINIVGLGNVGGTLLIGLRLLGGEKIKTIGIFDTNKQALSRWEQEANQVIDGSNQRKMPQVKEIQHDQIFQADMVIFCISIGVPPPQKEVRDVRLMQLKANSKIINYYAQRARKASYNGIFAVISDPVDLLCQSAFLASNVNEAGDLDGKGLSPDQIRGFGLGVMHARASYYAQKDNNIWHYLKRGRAFGPHGKNLVIADNVENYNHRLSSDLTKKVLHANIELRKIGFKPYIAPALSSGALSLLAFMDAKWHYSAGFLGGIFWGCRNRQTSLGLEWEQYHLPSTLLQQLDKSYQILQKQAKKLEK